MGALAAICEVVAIYVRVGNLDRQAQCVSSAAEATFLRGEYAPPSRPIGAP